MFDREVYGARRPSKKPYHASSSTGTSSVTSSGHEVWADLLDCLLHQIIALLSSFSDLLAFSGTCRSWHAAFSSFPSNTLSLDVPPLYLQPHTRYPRRNRRHAVYNLLYNCEWQLTDPVKRSSSRRCSPPRNYLRRMNYLGCSYGHLIFSNSDDCLLVDVFRGTALKPPRLKSISTGNHYIYYGILNAPINSSDSYLLLFSRSSMFQWHVGSSSWLEHPVGAAPIIQIVFFKGEMYALHDWGGIYTISMAPKVSVKEDEIEWEELWGEDNLHNIASWLVVCDYMLLLVDLYRNIDNFNKPGIASATFRVFRLDFSGEQARWVKVENLGNHVTFVSFDMTNPAFCCTSPERWGGKSNSIYVATESEDSDEPWTVVELGRWAPCQTWRCVKYRDGPYKRPDNLWVIPSLVYDVGH